MKRFITFYTLLCAFILASFAACDSSTQESAVNAKATVKNRDVCSLLSQEGVDQLFGFSAGPGKADTPASHVSGCIWPADGVPKFIVQVVPAPSDLKKSIDMGEGYKVVDIEGLSGKAAVAIQLGKPEFNIPEGVAILGIIKGNHMITLSPVMLNVLENSPEFTQLKKLAESAAKKL